MRLRAFLNRCFTRLLVPATCSLVSVLGTPAEGFVLQTDQRQGQVLTLHWPESDARDGISYWVDPSTFPFPESDVVRVVRSGFDAWQAVETSSVVLRYRGTGKFRPSATDRRNVVVYDATGRDIDAPPGTGVIALTRVNWNERGEVLDTDIVFNGRDFSFSVDPRAVTRGVVDLQAVLTHEIGHFLGLDHTPLGGAPTVRPTMYPFYFGDESSLEMDDSAGVSVLYPSPSALSTTGAIAGRVTHPGGSSAFGVHVVASQAGTSVFIVGSLSGSAGVSPGPSGDGGYEISGLPPGDYQVAIEPVAGPVTYENLGGIFHRRLDNDFLPEFYDNSMLQVGAQSIRVSAGRVAGDIDFVLGASIPGFPFIREFVLPVNTPDTAGPYRVEVQVTDDGGVASAHLSFRLDGGPLQALPLQRGSGDRFSAQIPGQPRGTIVEYRLVALDADANETVYPPEELPMLRFDVLALSSEPVLYVALRRSQVLSVVDTGPGKEVARIPTGDTPLSVALTPDERYVFVANSGTDAEGSETRVTVIKAATHRVVATLQVGLSPLDLAVSPDGRWVYVTNSRGRSISVLDVSGLREHRRYTVPTVGEGPYGIAAGPDGRRLYVTDIDANEVLVLDAGAGALLKRIPVVESPRSLALSPQGDRLYVAGFDGGISVVDTEGERVLRTISTLPAGGIFRLTLSPGGRLLYATDWRGANLIVVDLSDNDRVTVLPALTQGVNTRDLAVSADGRVVYVANQDSNDLLFVDAATLRVTKALKLEDGPRGIAVRSLPVPEEPTVEDAARADFDASGRVDFVDFLLFARAFGSAAGDTVFDNRFDFTEDDRVDFGDFIRFAGVFGRTVAN